MRKPAPRDSETGKTVLLGSFHFLITVLHHKNIIIGLVNLIS